jgi:hypothetical protein
MNASQQIIFPKAKKSVQVTLKRNKISIFEEFLSFDEIFWNVW